MTDIRVSGGLAVALVVVAGVVWVVGGNALIGAAMSRVHRALREDLAGRDTLFDELAVPTTVTASAWFSWSRTWVTADILVTGHAAVLFQRNRFIAQPPIQLLRSADDPEASTRRSVARIVISGAPRIEDGRVVVEGLGRRVGRWKLVIDSKRPEELVGALDRYLHPRQGAGPFRAHTPK